MNFLNLFIFDFLSPIKNTELGVSLIKFFGIYFIYILVALFFIYLFVNFRDKKKFWIWSGLSILAVVFSRLVFTEIIRVIFLVNRPFVILGVEPIILHESVGSFPSGHMAILFALVYILFIFNKKLGWWLAIFSLLVGIARISAGVHWPSDILGGMIVGVLGAWLTLRIFKKFF